MDEYTFDIKKPSASEQQLRLTDRPIKDISAALGFCDAFYFSRVFSARYGVSPSEYRRTRGG